MKNDIKLLRTILTLSGVYKVQGDKVLKTLAICKYSILFLVGRLLKIEILFLVSRLLKIDEPDMRPFARGK
jgi:hypothetical protein